MNLDVWLQLFDRFTHGDTDMTYDELRDGICNAAIDERTISTVVVTSTAHYDEIARPEDQDSVVTMSQTAYVRNFIPDGEYLVVSMNP